MQILILESPIHPDSFFSPIFELGMLYSIYNEL